MAGGAIRPAGLEPNTRGLEGAAALGKLGAATPLAFTPLLFPGN